MGNTMKKINKNISLLAVLIFVLLISATSSLMAQRYTFFTSDYCFNYQNCNIYTNCDCVSGDKIFHIYTDGPMNDSLLFPSYYGSDAHFDCPWGWFPIGNFSYSIWCDNCLDENNEPGCWQHCGDDDSFTGYFTAFTGCRIPTHEYLNNEVSGNNINIKNSPNPFIGNTEIIYSVVEDGLVRIDLYAMTGEKIAVIIEEQEKAGNYRINFDAGNIPEGVYSLVMQAGTQTTMTKVLIIK
jgi:hypothetical protein